MESRKNWDTKERNWKGICVFKNLNYEVIIQEMEQEAKQAKQKFLELHNATFTKNFIFNVSINRAYSIWMIKEYKLTLLHEIFRSSACRVMKSEFHHIVKQTLIGLAVEDKDEVLSARTAKILNMIYASLDGEEDEFLPEDLQEYRERLQSHAAAMAHAM